MNETIPHILTDKEGRGYDIVEMTRNQATSLNDRLKSEKSIYAWKVNAPAEYHHAIASKRHADLEGIDAFIRAFGSPWTADRLERDPGGPGRAVDRAGAIVDDLSREMCFFDFNFRAVLRDLPDEALETLEAIIARAKKERSPRI